MNKIFISWSGENSKRIAEELKCTLEQGVFSGGNLSCFVSTRDIASGEDWYKKIEDELKESSLGIMCITKENVKAPWLYFEAGALVGNNLRVIPLLINCDQRSLDYSPIQAKQSTQFYNQSAVFKMFDDIKDKLKLLSGFSDDEIKTRYETAYDNMKKNLRPKRYFSEKYIYPEGINTIKVDTVYISAPMSAITTDEYKSQRKFLADLRDTLLEKGIFREVYCPAIKVEPNEWEGITTAVKKNYNQLRQVQHMIAIYEKPVPTSTLVEIGYCISLCKNVVIFHKGDLPFMLEGAAEDIPHLHTRKFNEYSDITRSIMNDISLFKGEIYE